MQGSGGELKLSNFRGAVHQRGNALRDAPRHKSAPRYRLKAGRGASGKAYPRGAWVR
ncbi:DUF1534 domain-containing protein [Pseudomonas syringae pv. syringae]|nr:DUF1534 domain-containing protein [Pseudomonas syringae pv. syringae]MCF5552754.1 DUF1534 domain-containing protein [Pseudomonas syringae]POP61635.1 DUF1534 domain-containing protein [Pseudomonas syringae pv. syringae]